MIALSHGGLMIKVGFPARLAHRKRVILHVGQGFDNGLKARNALEFATGGNGL